MEGGGEREACATGWEALEDALSRDVDYYGGFGKQKTRAVASLKTRMPVVMSIEAFNPQELIILYVLVAE